MLGRSTLIVLFGMASGVLGPAPCPAKDVRVADADGFRRAAAAAGPGDRILLEPGTYPGGFSFTGLKGAPGKPIVLGAADSGRPPVIRGGGSGLQLTDPVHVEIENLVISGASGNGLNIDDGGSFDSPAQHLVIRGVTVSDIGPRGNHDGIKLSGVVDFRVEGSTIERWGVGGSAIDMVGCHRGTIQKNTFRHQDEQMSNGVQAKGGSSKILVRGNRFERAGGRGVNIGGSTGLAYFRPPLAEPDKTAGARWEAREIVVEGNIFIGGAAAVAFVGADRSIVRFNTIYRPRRWALRILQENQGAGFGACRNGEFSDNIVVFETRGWGGAANVGPQTAADTFRFAKNVWYALDDPPRSRPNLPAREEGDISGRDPLFVDAEKGDFSVRPESPARKAGAQALPSGVDEKR